MAKESTNHRKLASRKPSCADVNSCARNDSRCRRSGISQSVEVPQMQLVEQDDRCNLHSLGLQRTRTSCSQCHSRENHDQKLRVGSLSIGSSRAQNSSHQECDRLSKPSSSGPSELESLQGLSRIMGSSHKEALQTHSGRDLGGRAVEAKDTEPCGCAVQSSVQRSSSHRTSSPVQK